MSRNLTRDWLEKRGRTVYWLAKQTGISLKQMYALVNATEIPPRTTWETLKKIRDALELDCVDQLESND